MNEEVNKKVKRVRRSFEQIERLKKELAAQRELLKSQDGEAKDETRKKIKELREQAIFAALFSIAALNV